MRAVLVVAALGSTAVAAPKATPVQLTWVVHASAATDENYKQALELEVTTAGKTKTITLKPQVGALYAYNQIACKTDAYPLGKNEVAKITFYEGGAGGYFVRHKGSAYELVDWFLTDGACDDKKGNFVACPRQEKLVQKLAVPANAQLVDRIIEVDLAGQRTPFVCGQ
ncbi:MAG TPA: hypothetical protein VGM90_36585 [Kofleriaceae bacterium]|jgi:hypothetical protein